MANRRRAQSNGLGAFAEDDFASKVEAELRAYYNNVLVNEIEVAKKNCEKGKAIFPKALSWARSAQLLGLGETFAKEIDNIMSALVDALVNCYNESFDKCVDKNDPAQVMQMLSALRQLALLGADGQVDQSKMERCARFELDFESVIEELQPFGEAFAWRHQVRATVPLTFSFTNGPTGNATLVYSSVTYIGPSVAPCTHTSVGANSVFQVLNTLIDLNVFEGNAPPPQALTMEYDPGDPNFTFTLTCPESPPVVFAHQRWRGAYYQHNHSGEVFGSGFLARDWARVGGGIYARRTYQITSPFAVETTIMNLKHTPQ